MIKLYIFISLFPFASFLLAQNYTFIDFKYGLHLSEKNLYLVNGQQFDREISNYLKDTDNGISKSWSILIHQEKNEHVSYFIGVEKKNYSFKNSPFVDFREEALRHFLRVDRHYQIFQFNFISFPLGAKYIIPTKHFSPYIECSIKPSYFINVIEKNDFFDLKYSQESKVLILYPLKDLNLFTSINFGFEYAFNKVILYTNIGTDQQINNIIEEKIDLKLASYGISSGLRFLLGNIK